LIQSLNIGIHSAGRKASDRTFWTRHGNTPSWGTLKKNQKQKKKKKKKKKKDMTYLKEEGGRSFDLVSMKHDE